MATEEIYALIQKGFDAQKCKDGVNVKRYALHALAATDLEKEKFIHNQGTETPVCEGNLASCYIRIHDLLIKIGEDGVGTLCLYTAMLFDPYWSTHKYTTRAETLWMKNIRNKNDTELKSVLKEVDKLAKVGESLQKWSVSLHIYDDLLSVFEVVKSTSDSAQFESNVFSTKGDTREFLKHKDVSDVAKSIARCCFTMGNYERVQRICCVILEDASDYDDAVLLELWARSLYQTNDLELAHDKCRLALKYCKNEDDNRRLTDFQLEIQHKINDMCNHEVPNKEWSEDRTTNYMKSSTVKMRSERRMKRKRRQPKETYGLGLYVPSGYKASPQPKPEIPYLSNRTDFIKKVINKLKFGNNTLQANSYLSDETRETSGYVSFDSDDESEKNGVDFKPHAGKCGQEIVSQGVTEDEHGEAEMSYFEQSNIIYKNNIPIINQTYTYQQLLKSGIRLSSSCLQLFKDTYQSFSQREPFYDRFLTKTELQNKLLEPEKYKKCSIQLKKNHAAICTPTDPSDTIGAIEISGRQKIGQVFCEDEVVVEIIKKKQSKKKAYGRVIGILNRKRLKNIKHPVFMCCLEVQEESIHAVPLCNTVSRITLTRGGIISKLKTIKERKNKTEIYDYNESEACLCNPEVVHMDQVDLNSVIVLVAYLDWKQSDIYPKGAIIKMFQVGSDISSGLELLNLKHNVPHFYSRATIDQVSSILKQFGNEPPDTFLHDRRDLTDQDVFTIDPPGSLHLDDALSIDVIEGGYKIGVHISDVTSYIQKDSPLDKEAMQRGKNFYIPLRKPRSMLPEPLSSNLCSLLPDKLRLTISVFLYIDYDGRPMQKEESNYEIVKSYIRSKKQLTYQEAQEMILAPKRKNEDKITTDVKKLFKIAKKIRKNRLGNSMFAMDLNVAATDNGGTETACVEAHYLVEEFMIMTNRKVEERLMRTYKHCVPLLCQPPPSNEDLEDFLKKYGIYVDVLLKLQDKQIGPNRVSFEKCTASQTSVPITKSVWDQMTELNENTVKFVRTDELHPIQLCVYKHWISIQKHALYRCSGSYLSSKTDAMHYGLGMSPYTHFTSPIRRYSDLVAHRLVHAACFTRSSSPYTSEEIEDICVHLNSKRKQNHEFETECSNLMLAAEMKAEPRIVNCYITDVTETGIKVCSAITKKDIELSFSLLDVWDKSDIFENKYSRVVNAVYKKRLYDFEKGTDKLGIGFRLKTNPHKGLKLNPNKDVVAVPLNQWAKLIECSVEERIDDACKLIKKMKVPKKQLDVVDDVSTEREMDVRTHTTFSTTFSLGQQIQLQMSAEMDKGKMFSKPLLFNMTNNVKVCIQHREHPVSYLCQYATRATAYEYKNADIYVKRWIPIIQMESATNTVINGQTCCLKNVAIDFLGNGTGTFTLGLDECARRNIVISCEETGFLSYDWLCLKATYPSRNSAFGTIWVGHANVTGVKKDKVQGTMTVTFTLHERAPALPVTSANTRFMVEILPKSHVDRQTESLIQTLPKIPDSLAARIALNQPIPDLDLSHKHTVSAMEKDLYFNNKNFHLHRNNKKQQEAVDKALISRFSLIQGPPGTGKTLTALKLIHLFMRKNDISCKEGKPRRQVLFCGPSNKSVDLVAEWMYQKMGTFCPNFVRVYSQGIEEVDFPIPGEQTTSYTANKTPPSLYPVALHHVIRQKGKPFAEKIKTLERKLALFDVLYAADDTSPSFRSLVYEYIQLLKLASQAEIKKYDVILCTTTAGFNTNALKEISVQQVIIDEAGMCSEPHSLVPIIATRAEQVVLIGDHKQLRPTILCSEAASLGLGTSLFERYANTKCARSVPLTMLEEQYRMNPQLCRFPSDQFYDGRLITQPSRWLSAHLDIWPKDAKERSPFVFVHVEGEETSMAISTADGNENSKSNAAEIKHVLMVYSYITKMQPKASVKILSQYNAQHSGIKRALREQHLSDEMVGTVVSSQGGEWDFVIFSTVRSLPAYKIERNPTRGWCKNNLGFIVDNNQLNVALTRARMGLIIIGNKNLLSCDPVWKKLLKHYEQNGCIKTPDEFPPSTRTVRIREKPRRWETGKSKPVRTPSHPKKQKHAEPEEDGWQMVRRKHRR